ncbi:hypothetical protein ACWCPS_05030 [Streptomyces mauvecolor]
MAGSPAWNSYLTGLSFAIRAREPPESKKGAPAGTLRRSGPRAEANAWVGSAEDHLLRGEAAPSRAAGRGGRRRRRSTYVEIDSGHAAATGRPEQLLKVVQDFLA